MQLTLIVQLKKSQNCVKAMIAFVCTSCKKTTFDCAIAIDNFCLIDKFFMNFFNLQVLYALLLQLPTLLLNCRWYLFYEKLHLRTFGCIIVFPLTISLCIIAINIFCMNYCNWQLFMHLCSCWLLCPLFDYSIIIDILCSHYCILQIDFSNVSYIDRDSIHTLIAALYLV